MKHPNSKDLLGYDTLSPQDKVRVNDVFGWDQEEEDTGQSNYEIQERNDLLRTGDVSATNHSVYALRYQHEELASCDVRSCHFGHRMMENSVGLLRFFGKGEGTVRRRWMHIQCVPPLQVQLVRQGHPLGTDLPGFLTLTEEERSQVDRTFGWRATDPSPPSPAVEHNAWNEARVDSWSATPRSRTDWELKEDNHNLASLRPSLTEDYGENNIESDLLVSSAYFSLWMQLYSEIRVDTASFLVQMAVGTDTYKDFRAALRFPKRRVTPDKRLNEAKVLTLELKIKEADFLVAEAELEAAEARVRTEAARLLVVEQKKKMTAMGFQI